MKQVYFAVFFLIVCVKVGQGTNITNSTNVSIPTNSSINATTPLTTLYIGAFFDLGSKTGYGSLPMAEQAIEEINNNTDILPGYRLQLVVSSTQGSFGFGQKVFQEFLSTGPTKIMLLGPEEDSLAKSIAAYAGIPEVSLLQFSYGTSDLELASRRDLYPNFFRTTTSLASLDAPRISFIKEYGWDEVGIIYGDSVAYLKLSNQLTARLKQNNIKVLAEVRLQGNDPTRAIRTIKDKGIHVILGMFSLNAAARKMICEAYHQKMYGPHYVWVLLNSFNNNWWIPGKNEEIACSDVEMKCQIQNHFSFYHTNVVSFGKRFYDHANKNGSQIIADYRAKVDNGNDTSNRSGNFLNVYDAVWSIAFALDESRDELLKQGKVLENLTYGDTNATAVFRSKAKELDFATPNTGTSVRYYANGDRKKGIVLKQLVIIDGKFKMVGAGKFDVDTSKLTASTEIHWFAGTPYTKTTETYTYRTIDWNLFLALVVLASLGIVYALFCILTLVLNFKKKLVQNSGPVISMLIIIGCVLNYVTVILYGFDYSLVSTDTVTSLCRARAWTFAIGFTLSVGGLAAKLWMAYSVLKERFVRSRNIMMFWMLGILFFFLIIDVIILACWEGKDPLYRALKQVRSQPEYKCFEPITADTFRAEVEVVEHCDCADMILWLVVILVFKFIILLSGGFLAWQTRRLYIPALNDTQHCVACMFVAVLFCIIGCTVAFTTTMYPSAYYGVIGLLIIIATTVILVLLFTNKVARLSCRRKQNKTLGIGQSSTNNNEYACACSRACAKLFSFCACSAACCISCCSCFPCCNLYSCLRSIFYGSHVHPTEGGGKGTKAEFYIAGVPQDKDTQIIHLKNELREKTTQLSNLGTKRTVKTNWTQTMDESSIWKHEDLDSDSMLSDTNVSDAESAEGSQAKQRFRRAANKFRVFNQATDYSHVRSKVNTGLRQTSLAPSSSQLRRGSRMSVQPSPDENVNKLKTTLAQRDQEIAKLRQEIDGLKTGQLIVKSPQRSSQEQDSPSKMQRIVLIETPATPIPPEDPDDETATVQLPVTSSPSKQEESSVMGKDTTSEKPGTVSKTQDRSKKKSSLGPAGSWLLKEQSESTEEREKNPEKITARKNSTETGKSRERDNNPTTNTPRKHDKDSNKASPKGRDDTGTNKKTSPESAPGSEPQCGDNKTPTLKDNEELDLQASLTHVKLSEALANNKDNEKGINAATNVNDEKQEQMPDKNEEKGTGNLNKGSNEKEQTKAENPRETENSNDEIKSKKKSVHRKISSWLFGDNEDEEATKADRGRTGDKDSKQNETGNNNHGGQEVKSNEEEKKNSLINAANDKLRTNSNKGDVKDEATRKDSTTQEVKEPREEKFNEYDDERKNKMIAEDAEGEEDDDFGDDDDDDDDDDNDENGRNRAGAAKATTERRGSKKGTRRRRKVTHGKLKWNAQSKVDTGSSSYKPRTTAVKIPNFKNDYSHVKSRLSTLNEAQSVSANTPQKDVTPRKRSISVHKSPLPDYSNIRPRLYNGATRKYNSEMPSTIQKH